MVNATSRSFALVLLLAAVVLTTAAAMRGAEYDEQYTLFLTAGTARPVWPEAVFSASAIPAIQAGTASLGAIAHDLRVTDVHPPFYFCAVSLWRGMFGPGLFTARLFSVLCGLVSLALVRVIARRCGIRPVLPMLLTLGSYGFVYTNVIARGFAPAEALTLAGAALLTWRRSRIATLTAGALFGAACCCNYLAVFVAATIGVLVGGWLILPGAAPFLALDAWFFAAQHGARDGQFPPFSLFSALPRLAGYQVASLFGGLPLYLVGGARIAVGAAIGALSLALLGAILAARPLADVRTRILLAAAAAPAAGLLALGMVFNNTPIELRYLSFGAPFIALLTAWAFERSRRWMRPLLITVAAVQSAAIIGLVAATPTMQPYRTAARAAASLAHNAVVLLPSGNDGVGIVGAFGLEAPHAMPLLLVQPTQTAAELRAHVVGYHRVVLALLAQDRDSTASLPIMRQAFSGPGWRQVATGSNIEAYDRTAE